MPILITIPNHCVVCSYCLFLVSITASCIFRHLNLLHIWSQTLVQWIGMGLLDSCLHFSPSEELVSVSVWVLHLFLLEKCEKELSCFWAGIPFPHTTSTVLPGQHKLLDGLWLPLFFLASLKAHHVPREVTSPVSLGRVSAVTCHFVSMVSALTRSATLAMSPRLNTACRHRHGKSLWFHVSWKHHTCFYHLGTAPALNYYAVALGWRSLVQKD